MIGWLTVWLLRIWREIYCFQFNSIFIFPFLLFVCLLFACVLASICVLIKDLADYFSQSDWLWLYSFCFNWCFFVISTVEIQCFDVGFAMASIFDFIFSVSILHQHNMICSFKLSIMGCLHQNILIAFIFLIFCFYLFSSFTFSVLTKMIGLLRLKVSSLWKWCIKVKSSFYFESCFSKCKLGVAFRFSSNEWCFLFAWNLLCPNE